MTCKRSVLSCMYMPSLVSSESLTKEIAQIKNLYYKKNLSAQQIANVLGLRLGAVYYRMRRFELTRRNPTESNRLRFIAKAPSFSLRSLNSFELKELKVTGTALYWAEGYKRGHLIDFANSDVAMAKIFMRFLRKVCGVQEKKLRAKLFCYQNQSPKELMQFWSENIGIPLFQFHEPYIRKNFVESNQNRLPNGLIHIIYCDKKLLLLVDSWIKEYSARWAGT